MKLLGPMSDQFYGRREGSFIDPFGYTWNISTVKEEMSVEEMHRRMAGDDERSRRRKIAPRRRAGRQAEGESRFRAASAWSRHI